MNFCPSCGNVIKPGLQFCTVCGKRFLATAGSNAGAAPAAASNKRGFLPRYGVRRMRYGEVLSAIRKKLRIPQLLLGITIAAAAACLVAAAVLKTFLEYPVQFQVTHHGMYLSTTKALLKFDTAGKLAWKKEQAGDAKLGGRLEFDFGKDGSVYLANPAAHRVDVFDAAGHWRFSFGERELGEHFTLAALESGNVAVADTGHHDVKFFTPGGVLTSRAGGNGTSPGMFNYPNGVGQLPDGTVLVAETNNLRIQLFDGETLRFKDEIWSLGGMASSPAGGEPAAPAGAAPANGMRFYWPVRLAVDRSRERFYVVYTDDFKTPDGYLGIFDFTGDYVGQASLRTGIGEHVDATTLRPGMKENFTFVDMDQCRAGFWNPGSENVMLAMGDELGDYLGKLRRISGSHGLAGKLGKSLFLAALLGLAGFLLFVYIVYHDLEIERLRAAGAGSGEARTSPGGRIAAVVASVFFPGLGQLLLKRYVLGAVFVVLSALCLVPVYLHYTNVFNVGSMPVPVGISTPVFLPPHVISAAVFLVFYAGSLAHAAARAVWD